jgi:hypothetical protein
MPALFNRPKLSEERTRALHIIARSLFRELRAQGYEPHHIILLSSELIDVVIEAMKTRSSEVVLESKQVA